MAHTMLTLCAIGCTGVGKSSLCNLLSGGGGTDGGCDAPGGFGVSSGIDACTQQTVTGVHKYLGIREPVKLIDTPGQYGMSFSKQNTVKIVLEFIRILSSTFYKL